MTPEQELHRAREAQQLLDSDLFQAARKNLEDQLATIRRTVPIRDTDMHTRIILMGQLWENLVGYFEQLALTGKLAEIQLREKEQHRSIFERGVAMFRTSGRNSI